MRKIVVLLAVAVFLLAGCAKQDDVNKGANAVINAMMTCPNSELYNADMVAHLGLGVTTTEESKAKIAAATETAIQNWDKAVGSHFAPNCFESFFTGSAALHYLSLADTTDVTIAVETIALQTKQDGYEVYLVTLSVGEEEQQAEVTFQYDAKGLITKIELNPVTSTK